MTYCQKRERSERQLKTTENHRIYTSWGWCRGRRAVVLDEDGSRSRNKDSGAGRFQDPRPLAAGGRSLRSVRSSPCSLSQRGTLRKQVEYKGREGGGNVPSFRRCFSEHAEFSLSEISF